MDELGNRTRALLRDALQKVRQIPEEESRSRFAQLLDERTQLAEERGWTEDEVERDVAAVVREVRRAR